MFLDVKDYREVMGSRWAAGARAECISVMDDEQAVNNTLPECKYV